MKINFWHIYTKIILWAAVLLFFVFIANGVYYKGVHDGYDDAWIEIQEQIDDSIDDPSPLTRINYADNL